jgi:flagellar biosynthesis GTPase FlhF
MQYSYIKRHFDEQHANSGSTHSSEDIDIEKHEELLDCLICDEFCKTYLEFDNHLKEHKEVICKLCDRPMSSVAGLKSHFTRHKSSEDYKVQLKKRLMQRRAARKAEKQKKRNNNNDTSNNNNIDDAPIEKTANEPEKSPEVPLEVTENRESGNETIELIIPDVGQAAESNAPEMEQEKEAVDESVNVAEREEGVKEIPEEEGRVRIFFIYFSKVVIFNESVKKIKIKIKHMGVCFLKHNKSIKLFIFTDD